MENNEKKTEYYRVYLNGPEDVFYEKYIGYDKSRFKLGENDKEVNREKYIERSLFGRETIHEVVTFNGQGGMPIYCEFVDGKMIDLITGNEYIFANSENAEQTDNISYYQREKVSAYDVCNRLSGLNVETIKKYVDKVNELSYLMHIQYLNFMVVQKRKEIFEDNREELEELYEDFINNFHKNYCKLNTKTRRK